MAIGQFCCSVCGSREFKFSEVLWDGLTDEWQICEEERRYIDRQQGEQCIRCGSNLRSIALADGLRNVFSTDKTLSDFVASASSKASILEINEAGTLHSLLMKLPGHGFTERNPTLAFSRASTDPGDMPQDGPIPEYHPQIPAYLRREYAPVRSRKRRESTNLDFASLTFDPAALPKPGCI